MTAPDQPPWSHRQVVVDGVPLHYVEAGSGPLVVLLHGFPQCWHAWRWQIPALAEAGLRVIAPDLRGYNLSGKPVGVDNYHIQRLAEDVRQVILQSGAMRASVIGHDWGGYIAWRLAACHPDLVERLALLNAPHPGVWLRELRRPRQLARSWYQFFFQLPALPEMFMRWRDYAVVRTILRRDPARPGAFSAEEIHQHREALAQPGALTAAINYYRAAFRAGPGEIRRSLRRLDLPTLVIWGEQDRYLNGRLTHGLEDWHGNLRVERLPAASHWVMNDAPEEVNRLLRDFLTRS